ncbi:MAG: Na+/H+ antiporter subunit E [Microthrixaceae bacterium]
MGRDHLYDDTAVDDRSPLAHRIALQLPIWFVAMALWVALWGDASIGNLIGGAAVATLLAVLFHPGRRERLGRLRFVAALRFSWYVIVSLTRSTISVAWEVLTPSDHSRPGILAVQLPSATPVVLTAVTTAVGLTPGTVVVDVGHQPTILYVHVLHLTEPSKVRRDIARLEALALAAFGPSDATDDIELLTSEARASDPRRGTGEGRTT